MKRYFAAILAATMMLTMTMTAFATEGIANNDGTITINNAAEGMTYKVYELFKLEADNTYSVTAENPWYAFVTTDATASDYVSLARSESGAYTVTWTKDMGTAANVEAFTNAALAYAEANGITAAQSVTVPVEGTELPANVTKNSDETYSVVFAGLETGYYLLDSVTDTICVLGADTPMVIDDKTTYPYFKSFEGTDTAEIGGTIKYTVNITAPEKSVGRKFTATFDESIKLDDASIKIKNGETEMNSITVDTTSAPNSFSFTVPANSENSDITYTVTYSAELLKTAEIAPEKNTSKVQLEEMGNVPVDEKEVSTQTYAFDIKSVREDDRNTLIDGAEFKLYSDNACEHEINLVESGSGSYRLATSDDEDYVNITTINSGTVRVQGLKGDTTYYLKEAKTPAGYKNYTNKLSVTITTDANNVAVVTVEYSQGSLLPSTGGVGTTFCYILGTALMLGAGAVLVIRRRMFFE